MDIRQTLRSAIKDALEPMEECLSLVEGGSTAFGRDDELSDVDLGALVEVGTTDKVAKKIREAILSVAEIEREFELPQPTWHGAWQTFYRIKNYKYMMVDFCVSEIGKEMDLIEVERHGNPVVFFDKGGYSKTSNIDPQKTKDEIAKKTAKAEVTVNMFHDFVDKELDRGNYLDAMHLYIRMILNPTVDALRAKHDPHRHDFGARYLYFDLPEEIVKELESLFSINGPDELRIKKARAVEIFNEAIED